MKIICIGWNYAEHNIEMNRADTPRSPIFFLKPDSALLKDNKPFFIPDFSQHIEYETELVFKIGRLGKHISQKFAHRYYSEVALGIDFTARDLQHKCRKLGEPWEIAKSFDNSAVISKFVPLESLKNRDKIAFELRQNNKTVQAASSADMIFSIDMIVEYVSSFFTLKIGDLIFTGTPSGVGKVDMGDHLTGFMEGNKMFDFRVC